MKLKDHICQLRYNSSSFLPKLLPTSTTFQQLKRSIQKSIILSPSHPLTKIYFNSEYLIGQERRRQVKFHRWYQIHPLSNFRKFWDILILFVTLIYLWITPFLVAHYLLMNPDTLDVFCIIHSVISVILYVEIMLLCVTGYIHRNRKTIILQQSKIIRNYLMGNFFCDLLGALPLIFVGKYIVDYLEIIHDCTMDILFIASLIYILNLFSFQRINSCYTIIPYYYNWTSKKSLIIKVIVTTAYVVHWLTCLSYMVPMFGLYYLANDNVTSHISINKVFTGNHTEFSTTAYVYLSRYMITMKIFISTGHFDTTTELVYHHIIKCVIHIFGYICTSFVLFFFLKILQLNESSENKYAQMINEVSKFGRSRNFDRELQQRITTYYKCKFKEKYFNEDAIKTTISGNIRKDILIHQCRDLFKKVVIFKGLPHFLIDELINCLQLEIFLPGDIIIRSNTIGDSMYFLAFGSAEVISTVGMYVQSINAN